MMKILVIALAAYILIGCLVTIVIMKLFEFGVKEGHKDCQEAMEEISKDTKDDKNYPLKMQIIFVVLWPYMLWNLLEGLFSSDDEE